eukprot:1949071-Pleurochrysis_carterae.AAC.1
MFGGQDEHGALLNDLHIFDMETNAWHAVAPNTKRPRRHTPFSSTLQNRLSSLLLSHPCSLLLFSVALLHVALLT